MLNATVVPHHRGVELQLRNKDGSWPKRHNESSSSVAHCRTHVQTEICPSLPIIALPPARWLATWPKRSHGHNRTARPRVPPPISSDDFYRTFHFLNLIFSLAIVDPLTVLNSPITDDRERRTSGIFQLLQILTSCLKNKPQSIILQWESVRN